VWNEYAREKLIELESELQRRRPTLADRAEVRRARPLAPAVRMTGRGLRRLGEAIESWAAPAELRQSARAQPGAESPHCWREATCSIGVLPDAAQPQQEVAG
jgi:hypothetical protein